MSNHSLDPDQVEVEAELMFIQESGNPSLDSVQVDLARVMNQRGYDILNKGYRVWEFILQTGRSPPSFLWKVKNKIGIVDERDRMISEVLQNLRETRDTQPYRVKFRFLPTSWENGDEGYIVEVESIPAVSEKLDMLSDDLGDVNIKATVRANKSLIRDVSAEVGLVPLREAYTRAESFQTTLSDHLRKRLQGFRYGSNVIHFADDADEALRYSLTRPALSAYVHGIEWAIICYFAEYEDRDLMTEEGYGRGAGFKQLIEEIENAAVITQTTSEALRTMNTERIWMAHHKEGKVSNIEVKRIKKRFSILLEELFI